MRLTSSLRLSGLIPARVTISVDAVLMVTAVAALLYLIGIPLLMNIYTAFRGPVEFLPFEPEAVFTTANLTAAFGDSSVLTTFKDTAIFAVGSVAVAFVVGMPLAWLVERTNIPFRNAIYVIALVPIMLPPITLALAWIFMLGETNGFINVAIRNVFGLEGRGPFTIFSMYGMVLVQGLAMSTLIFLFLGASLRSMDPSVEEASATAGASFPTTLRKVTLPIMRPSILSVLILAIIFAIETFEIPLVLGLGARAQVFASNVYWALNPAAGLPRYGEMAAFSLSFLAITYLLFYFYSRVTRQAARFATVTGRGFRPQRFDLGRWKYVALGGIGVFALFQIIFPLGILIWASLLNRFEPPSIGAISDLSFDSFRGVFRDPIFWPAVRNTFAVAFGSATLVTLISAVVAWIVVRSNVFGKRLLDFIASSSVAIPGVIAGLALLIFYLTVSRWIPIFGTIWVLVLAYSYRLSLAYRFNVAGITQISKELEEASQASGATWANTFRRILVPLLAPTLIVVFIIIFFLGFRDFTLALMLNSRDNVVMSVLVWVRINTNRLGEGAAISVLSVGFMTIMVVIIRSFILPRLRKF